MSLPLIDSQCCDSATARISRMRQASNLVRAAAPLLDGVIGAEIGQPGLRRLRYACRRVDCDIASLLAVRAPRFTHTTEPTMRTVSAVRRLVSELTVGAAACASLACRPIPRTLPSNPPDIRGLVTGSSYDSTSSGPGGLNRIGIRLDPGSAPGLPPRAYARVDSATRFAVVTSEGIDWRLPDLHGAYVRVWFRSPPSTPTSVDFFGDARIVAIDSFATNRRPAAAARP